MKNRKDLFTTTSILMVLCLLMAARAEPAGDLSAVSPDGRIAIELEMQGGRPGYRVRYREKTVLSYSPLGLRLKDGAGKVIDLGEGLEIIGTARRCHDAYWTGLGKASRIRDHYEEVTVSLRRTQKPHLALEIVMRAYDDGVAFRYSLPGGDGLDEFALLAERTCFSFTTDALTYAQKLPYYISPYQSKYKPTKLSEIKPESLVGLPLLVEIPEGIWVALMEADLTDYAGMYLGAEGDAPYRLRAKLSPLWRRPGVKAVGRTPFSTPWRVVMIGEEPGDLIESNLIANLNNACVLPDVSWIKPGKAAWPWWSGNSVEGEAFAGGMDTKTMLHYIDFAVEANAQYLLIDAGWYKCGDVTRPTDKIDLPQIIAYAKERGIGVILWVDWKDLQRKMDEALTLYEQWGIAGLKVDYMYRDDQDMVRFYHTLAGKAADHRLVLDLHG
ncbi:MAG: glycoside hydrolase family 97 protein, partial [Firmicutes bacterium]|nr:glycoside hydrolase family 97 protein [Bacillota bacterium]